MLMNSNAVELLGTAYKFKTRNEICQCAFTTCCIINVCYTACGCIEDIKEMYQKAYVLCAALLLMLPSLRCPF